MDRFLFAADAALGSDQATLTNGQLAIFVETNDGGTKIWATGDSVKRFCVMVGGPSGRGTIATPYMDARPRKKILKKATPVAAVKQVQFVKFAAKGDSTMGSNIYDDWVVTVDIRGGMDLFGNEPQNRTYTVQGNFATETDLYNALAVQINGSDTLKDLVATVSGTTTTLGLYITPSDRYTSATLFVGAYHQPYSSTTVAQIATVTESTAWTPGSGTVADAKRLDVRQQASLGNYYQVDSELPHIADLVQVDGATYKSLYMYIENEGSPSDIIAKGNVVYVQTVIFMPNASTTNYAAVIAALEEILAGTFVASAIS